MHELEEMGEFEANCYNFFPQPLYQGISKLCSKLDEHTHESSKTQGSLHEQSLKQVVQDDMSGFEYPEFFSSRMLPLPEMILLPQQLPCSQHLFYGFF
jgi:hypothetical protein